MDNLRLKTMADQESEIIFPKIMPRESGKSSPGDNANNKSANTIFPFYQLSKDLCAAYVRTNLAEVDSARHLYVRAILNQRDVRQETIRLHFHYAIAQIVDAYRKRLGIYGNELQSMQEHFEEQLQSKETVQDLVVVFQETLKHLLALTLKPVQVSQSIRMEEAKRFIDENFNQNLKLEGVARENGFSVSAFGRAFKKEFGVGFSAYLRKVRLEHAKKLLVSTRLPISQVIQESGFNNPQYFFDLFKRSIGFTPQKFRDSFDR